MPVQHLWVPGPLPSLNELVEARSHFGKRVGAGKRRWNEYSDLKRKFGERVVLCARSQHLQPVESAYFTYIFFEPHKRRDPMNVAAGACKIIEDGLQDAAVIPNDGWGQVLGVALYWRVEATCPGVAVFLSKHAVLDEQTALYNDKLERT